MALIDLFKADTWSNVLSAIGVKGKDRRRETVIDIDLVTEVEARMMWQTDFLARACIEKVPETAYRDGGFNVGIKGASGKQLAEDIQTRLEELAVVPQLTQAAKFERAYGGAGLFPVLLDGVTDYTKPLNEQNIMTCKAVHVFEPRELIAMAWYDDIMQAKYRQPKIYRMQPVSAIGAGRSIEIHESRLILFPGVRISNDQTTAERPGWGDNALTVAKQTLADFGISIGGISAALDQFSQGVLSLDGLAEMLAQDQGKLVRERLVLMDQLKSMLRTLVISGQDKYERRDISFAGVEGMVSQLMYIVAAALDVPVALLFGMEPAGMNATGAFDIRSFYDRVGNVRTARYQTPTERTIRLTTMLPKDGPCKGKEPEQWSIEWKPLWQMSDKEREEARKMRTDNDVALVDSQIVSADEIRTARFGGDTYSYELQLTGPAPVPEIPAAHVAALEAANSNRPGRGGKGVDMRALAEEVLAADNPGEADVPSPEDAGAA